MRLGSECPTIYTHEVTDHRQIREVLEATELRAHGQTLTKESLAVKHSLQHREKQNP